MSTNYRPSEEISFNKLREQVAQIGLSIPDHEENNDDQFAITDGDSYLWCYRISQDDVEFVRYGANRVDGMLEKISAHFAVDMISEHDEGYYDDADFEQIEENEVPEFEDDQYEEE